MTKTACLIGNGTSVAYNHELSVAALTDSLIEEFETLGGVGAPDALQSLAAVATGAAGDQFEELLGPLESTATAIGAIAGLGAALVTPAQIAAVDEVRGLLNQIRRTGLGVVLGHIDARAQGVQGAFELVTSELGHALGQLGEPGDLCVASLNYDGLTHGGLFEHFENAITDLAAGYAPVHDGPDLGNGHLAGFALRQPGTALPDDKVALLHLHGFMGWLRHPLDDQVVKFSLSDLRQGDYWTTYRNGGTDWAPVVVLTDRKAETIVQQPFADAYERFYQELLHADRWLVMGYGLGDEPVNSLFRTARRERSLMGEPDPRCLVVTYGDPVEAAHHHTLACARLDLPPATDVSMDGVPHVFASAAWDTFVA